MGGQRVLETVEARIMGLFSLLLLGLAALFAFFPSSIAYPLAVLAAWMAIALLLRAYRLRRERAQARESRVEEPLARAG
jgi:cardiolipin synthase A/B